MRTLHSGGEGGSTVHGRKGGMRARGVGGWGDKYAAGEVMGSGVVEEVVEGAVHAVKGREACVQETYGGGESEYAGGERFRLLGL